MSREPIRQAACIYYERVSTRSDEQQSSLDNQRRLRDSYLRRHPEMKLVGSYSERISGKSDIRHEYNLMIRQVEEEDIQYILVKDLKRLNRSSEVSAQLRTVLKRNRCKLILLATGEIYDPNADDKRLIYGFESLVNEEVVFRQSEYGRIAHRQKMNAKRLNIHNVTFGYRWDKEKEDIVIDEEQAEIVRTIFDLYVFQNKGIKEICVYLDGIGIRRSKVTVNKWLKETAYIGVFCMNKKGSELGVGAGQKTKRFTNPEDEWVRVERPDLAIVDPDVFELAQKIRKKRQRLYDSDKNGIAQSRFRGFHLFSSKIFCKECGKSYVHGWSDREGTIGIYKDSYHLYSISAVKKCKNTEYKRLFEVDLIEIVLTTINRLLKESADCFPRLLKVLEQVLQEDVKTDSKKTVLSRRLKEAQKKRDKIKQAYIDAPEGMLRQALVEDFAKEEQIVQELQAEMEEIQNQLDRENDLPKRLREIENALGKLTSINELDRETVECFIYKMIISKDGELEIILNNDAAELYKMQNKERSPKKGSADLVFGDIDNDKSVVKKVTQDMEVSQQGMETA